MHHFIVVSGFTQKKWAKHGNGSINIYRNVRDILKGVGNIEFALLEWHNDPEGYARFVAQHYVSGDTIVLAGYSYGGGYWAREFLKTLKSIAPHIKVNTVILCDPVYRHPFFLMRFLALFSIKLKINFGNVDNLVHFFQTKDKPGNNSLILDEGVNYAGPCELDYHHVKMDNSVEYHDAVLEAAVKHFLEEKREHHCEV